MDWEPFDFMENGQAKGLSIDYLNLVAKKVGLNIEYINGYSWDELMEMTEAKEIDISHSLSISPERSKFLNFTDSYLDIPMVYYGQKGTAPINSMEDLKGKRMGALNGILSTEIYKEKYPHLTLVEFEKVKDGFLLLSAGEIDVYPVPLPQANYVIINNFITNVEIISTKFFPEIVKDTSLHLAARKDLPILYNILQKGQASITPQEFGQIMNKWQAQLVETANNKLSPEEEKWISEHPVLTSTSVYD